MSMARLENLVVTINKRNINWENRETIIPFTLEKNLWEERFMQCNRPRWSLKKKTNPTGIKITCNSGTS